MNSYCLSEVIALSVLSTTSESLEVFIEDLDTDSDKHFLFSTELKATSSTKYSKNSSSRNKLDYNQQYLVTFLNILSKYQLLDNHINSLIRALTKKDPTAASSEVAYLYNNAFIVHLLQIHWVRIKSIDSILISKSLRNELLFLFLRKSRRD